MKNIIFIILLFTSLLFSSCNVEYTKMKKALGDEVTHYSCADFKKHSTTTVGDEIAEQLKFYRSELHWDNSFYEAYKEGLGTGNPITDDKEKMDYYNEKIARDHCMIEYLESINKNYPRLFNKVSFTTYKMSYLYKNDKGDTDFDICFGKFDDNHNMVAFKPNAKAKWKIFGNTVSIPGYEKYQ